MRRLVVGPKAYRDIGEAALWYGDRSPGLGDDFLRRVDVAFAQIERAPQRFPLVHESIRRALLRRFPYAIYFVAAEDGSIRVIGCVHMKRDPERWRRRDRRNSPAWLDARVPASGGTRRDRSASHYQRLLWLSTATDDLDC